MKKPRKRKMECLALSGEQKTTLLGMAEAMGSLSTAGASQGRPSWRRFVADIADGEYIVRRRYPDRRRVAVVAPVAVEQPPVAAPLAKRTSPPEIPPLWWAREEDEAAPIMEISAMPAGLVAEARLLGIAEDEGCFIAPDGWLVEGPPAASFNVPTEERP